MKISIFGLGYVGCVGMGCLAENGHQIIGVDVQDVKLDLINQGKPTIIEKDLDDIIERQFAKGNVLATKDYSKAVLESSVSIICVGTPSTEEGHLNLQYIYETARQIGESLREKKEFHVIAIRSTVLPGTNIKVGTLLERASGKIRNTDFAVVSNPEFLREGTAVSDYFHPPLTVLGSDNDRALDIMESIYSGVSGPIERVDISVAEIIKYVNNSYHALKITFANEIGNICKKLNMDSHEVMRIFGMDDQLNISTYYFKPGFAYGGSCLPKDLKALKTLTHDFYLDSPVLNSIEVSNTFQKQKSFELITKTGKKKIGVLGLSFKPGTDDLRYSPIVDIIEKLHGKGYDIKIYDKNVVLARLVGKNKSFIEEKLPHISKMLTDNLSEVLEFAEAIVITNREKNLSQIEIPDDKYIVDFARISKFENHVNYLGLCW